MAEIEVSEIGVGTYRVIVAEGRSATTHLVTASTALVAEVGRGASSTEVVRASFAFLLDREPQESILRRFDLTMIDGYFPEYSDEIGRYLVAGEAAATGVAAFPAEALASSTWSAKAGYRFAQHRHDRVKVLFCVEGAITFHLADGDHALRPGDRLDLPAGTLHAATAGPNGVTCMEAFRE